MSVLRSKIACLALGAAVVGTSAGGCRPENQLAEAPVMPIEVAVPIERPVQSYLEFIGKTRARLRVDLRARISGYLQSIQFKDGAQVKEGDLLFMIDPAPYQAQVELAQAEVRKAEASLASQSIELQRTRALVQRTSASIQELDLQQAATNAAEASVAAAKAALRNAEIDLSYTEIRAPISGRIGQRMVDVGNLVQPQQTLLATIESHDPMYVDFTMSESDLLRLNATSPGETPVPLEQRNLEIEMGLANEAGFLYRGKMDFSDLGVDPNTGTIEYRASFPNPDGRLIPGLYAKLRTALGPPQNSILVPERAIGKGQQGAYVLVAEIEGELATIRDQPVKLGISQDGFQVVIEGLQGDEPIVVNGVQRARPGAKVKPILVDAVDAAHNAIPSRRPGAAEVKAEADAASKTEAPESPSKADGATTGPQAAPPSVRPPDDETPPATRPGPLRAGG